MEKQEVADKRTGSSKAPSSVPTGSESVTETGPSRKPAEPSTQPNANPRGSQAVRKPEPSRRLAQPSSQQQSGPTSSRSVRGPVPSRWAAQMSSQPKPRPASSQSARRPKPSGLASQAVKRTTQSPSKSSTQRPPQPKARNGPNQPATVTEAIAKTTRPGLKATTRASSAVPEASARKDRAKSQVDPPTTVKGVVKKATEARSADPSTTVKEEMARQTAPEFKVQPSLSSSVRQTVERKVETSSNSRTAVPVWPKETAERKAPARPLGSRSSPVREAVERRPRTQSRPGPSSATLRRAVESQAQARPGSKPVLPGRVAVFERTTATAKPPENPATSALLMRDRPRSQVRPPTTAKGTEEGRVSPDLPPGSPGAAQSDLRTKPKSEPVVSGAASEAREDAAQTALNPIGPQETQEAADMDPQTEFSPGSSSTAAEEVGGSKPTPRPLMPVQEAVLRDNPEGQPELPKTVQEPESGELPPEPTPCSPTAVKEAEDGEFPSPANSVESPPASAETKVRSKPKLTLVIPEAAYEWQETKSQPVLTLTNPLTAVRKAVDAEVQASCIRAPSPTAERGARGGSSPVRPEPGPSTVEEPAGRGDQPEPQAPEGLPTAVKPAAETQPETKPEPALLGPVQKEADRKAARLYQTRRGRQCALDLEVTMNLLRDMRLENDADSQPGQRNPPEAKVHWNDVRAQLKVEDDEIYGNWESWEVRDTRPIWMR